MEVILSEVEEEYFDIRYTDDLFCYTRRFKYIELIKGRIEECATSSGISAQACCRQIIDLIVRKHNIVRKFYPCSPSYDGHPILHVAVKLTFDYRLKDSELVSRLLTEIYYYEGTFEKLLNGAIFGINACYLLCNWKSDFKSQNENLEAVSYFLDHLNRSRTEFEGMRFLQVPLKAMCMTPMEAASRLGSPILAIMKKYGAAFGESIPGDTVPQTLLSLCRRTILQQLWKNWEIPLGVSKLELPKPLIDYLEEELLLKNSKND